MHICHCRTRIGKEELFGADDKPDIGLLRKHLFDEGKAFSLPQDKTCQGICVTIHLSASLHRALGT